MAEILFDQNDPLEKAVSERLEHYLHISYTHDDILNAIGCDFPYIDSELMERCEKAVYKHYHTTKDGKVPAVVKRIALLHSKDMDAPFYSHKAETFHIKDGEDLIMAVQVENPLYLYENADVNLHFSVDYGPLKEFTHTMSVGERRAIYYVPLNLLEKRSLREGAPEFMCFTVFNDNITGNNYDVHATIYYGDIDLSKVFSIDTLTLYLYDDKTDADVFNLKEDVLINLFARVKYNEDFYCMPSLGALVKITPLDSSDKANTIVRSFELSTSAMENCKEGTCVLCDLVGIASTPESIPRFKPAPGKYKLDFYLFDILLYSREIEFIAADGL